MPLAQSIRKGHIKLIARTYARHSIRGGSGLMFTFVTLVVGLVIAATFITILESVQTGLRREGMNVSTEELLERVKLGFGHDIVSWAVDTKEHSEYLVETKPVLISVILLVMLIAVPFLTALGAFNQLSGDIHNRGLRYVLLRTERINIILGRFIGTYLYTCAVLALLMAIVLLYMLAKARFYPAGDVSLWMLQGYVAAILLALPYVALCTWLSATLDSPFLSLFITLAIVGLLPLLIFLGTKWKPEIKYVAYATPWPFRYHLLHPNPLHVLGATGAMLAFTAAFLFLGVRTFQRRDL